MMKATINLILHSKGGMGKSFIASLMAQYFLHAGRTIACFDTDPSNRTFAKFKALNVKIIDIVDRFEISNHDDEGNETVKYVFGKKINERYFDILVEDLIAMPEDSDAIVDVGSSNFVQLTEYIEEGEILTFWKENDQPLRVHTIIAGGQNEEDSYDCLKDLLVMLDSQLIVWVNPFFGPVDFINSKIFTKNKHRFESVIHLPSLNAKTYGYDLMKVLKESLTFDEAVQNPVFNLMVRQRIKNYQKDIYALLGEGKAEL